MSTNAGAYDTSRLYRSGSHTMRDEDSAWRAPSTPPAAEVVRTAQGWEAYVAASLRPAAAAAVAYSEHLMATPDLPRDQQAVLDTLRRQAHSILQSLSEVAAHAHSDAADSEPR
jgi:hypothetical protein